MEARLELEEMIRIDYLEVDSPVGPLLLAGTENGMCLIEFGQLANKPVEQNVMKWFGRRYSAVRLQQNGGQLNGAAAQLREYFAGKRRRFELKLDLQGTPFQLKVWHALSEIPYGETRSYAQIAGAVGSPKAVRAVGGANNRNPLPIVIPCHRVIGSDGTLTGYGGGLSIKEHLLSLERGVRI
ncbi:methylated-DNA--[protein]-cysteine S-methyltransferase [Ferviditalea candida]|uniref:Methylated-DNA--protein-cysteine methyltransferase n=1 Tax=Ferviditalea candida TaxID=3108399 RepID=A0ABU5ZIC9_9BACL|nr:methylated-DNA--[protein]-cysteine S-methyltransferase [Paenibacillaceae bacterium T2]